MNMTSIAVAMGIGMAAGAVAVSMLPRKSKARKIVQKAACTASDAIDTAGQTISREMGL